uniref:Uncharacterized protein n=1 Tax=Candidatus Kentrum sp. FW TaxID=2126338 RepID=A0A450TUV9_9GAMM|nr:MAG: hypothetical protein BECKFW1821C_GA0114237_103724 [Candidatus Kentron sp. FW]
MRADLSLRRMTERLESSEASPQPPTSLSGIMRDVEGKVGEKSTSATKTSAARTVIIVVTTPQDLQFWSLHVRERYNHRSR